MSAGSLSGKENLQRQEDEKLCSCEEKHLEEVITANQQLLHATNEEMKRAKRLQVSAACDHVTESWLKTLTQRLETKFLSFGHTRVDILAISNQTCYHTSSLSWFSEFKTEK